MTRKAFLLGLSMVGISLVGVRGASAQDSFLPGNVWPNPDLSTAAPAGVDQVYSYYNGTYSSGGPYVPNATGDTNPRPNGWHRGGGDFGTTSTPSFTFYNTPGNSAGEGTAPAGNSDGYALEVNDNSTSNYGEWFSDWNALPANVTANPGTPFYFRFYYEITNVSSTVRPENSDQFRVSAYFGDSTGSDVLNAPNQLGNSTDFIIPAGSPDVTSWTEVDEVLTAPPTAQSMRITVDSGGSSAATGQIWVSDISVSAVPEPASIAGIAAGSMLLLARRRRAQQI
jgi:hypothetical protein